MKNNNLIKHEQFEILTYVYQTYNYDLFKRIKGNRELNKTNLKKLIESSKVKQLEIPITVNEKMEIIDGQHRFNAWRTLELPIIFQIKHGYGIEDVQIANSVSLTWKLINFLDMHLKDGNKNYEFLNEIFEKENVGVSIIKKVISKITKKKNIQIEEELKAGVFEMSPCEKLELKEFMYALKDFREFKFYKEVSFTTAFTDLYFYDGYDHEKMKKRLKTKGSYLKKQRSKNDYLEILCNKIYSSGNTVNPIYFINGSIYKEK